jgi:hypothetical protein
MIKTNKSKPFKERSKKKKIGIRTSRLSIKAALTISLSFKNFRLGRSFDFGDGNRTGKV